MSRITARAVLPSSLPALEPDRPRPRTPHPSQYSKRAKEATPPGSRPWSIGRIHLPPPTPSPISCRFWS